MMQNLVADALSYRQHQNRFRNTSRSNIVASWWLLAFAGTYVDLPSSRQHVVAHVLAFLATHCAVFPFICVLPCWLYLSCLHASSCSSCLHRYLALLLRSSSSACTRSAETSRTSLRCTTRCTIRCVTSRVPDPCRARARLAPGLSIPAVRMRWVASDVKLPCIQRESPTSAQPSHSSYRDRCSDAEVYFTIY